MKRKFNLVDLIVVLFVCALLIFVIAKFSHITSAGEISANSVEITYSLKVNEIIDRTAEAIPASGTIYDKDGNTLGEIMQKEVSTEKSLENKSNGDYVIAEIPDKFDVILTISANAVKKSEGYFVNGKKCVGVGSELTVTAPYTEFLASIVDLK